MEFVDTIVVITPKEFQDPTWEETTIGSTDQKTVQDVNEELSVSNLRVLAPVLRCETNSS